VVLCFVVLVVCFVLRLWGELRKFAFLVCFRGFLVFSVFWGVLTVFDVFLVF